MFDLMDKNALVTGASGGIGGAIARALHAAGARVGLSGTRAGALDALAGELGDGAFAVPADLSSANGAKTLVKDAEAALGGIDILVNNAGLTRDQLAVRMSDEDWQTIWEVNLMSHVYAARNLIPRMAARGGGYLLNTSSAAGLLSQIGSVTYAVTKHAAVALAEWLAITHGHEGIKVSVLCPQAVRTAMTAGNEGGVASVDGMIEAEQVADTVIEALAEERFLVLPHPEVAEYMRRKAGDYDRWLRGMQRLNQQYNT